MKATILIDNISENQLLKEWGLSIFIQYEDKKILLDTGASDNFLKNADALGIDIASVDYGILSHAHYDHADGMDAFFTRNSKADFYLRKECAENCYGRRFLFSRYIGIQKGILQKYQHRIIYADGKCEVTPGVTLLPHTTSGLSSIGKKNHLYIRKSRSWYPDDFAHEQSLVFDTQPGLVIFNSCSHGGADNIIREVSAAYPAKKIYALIGGFHLFNSSKEDVAALADRVKATGIEKIYTGHCTGQQSFDLLKEKLGDCIVQLKTGLVIEV